MPNAKERQHNGAQKNTKCTEKIRSERNTLSHSIQFKSLTLLLTTSNRTPFACMSPYAHSSVCTTEYRHAFAYAVNERRNICSGRLTRMGMKRVPNFKGQLVSTSISPKITTKQKPKKRENIRRKKNVNNEYRNYTTNEQKHKTCKRMRRND